jgi:RNA polymerase sigma factor (sigma-70 family)
LTGHRLEVARKMSNTTRWSLVLAARGDEASSRRALAELCTAYRPVLLAYFRRHGDSRRAEDETQAFFLHFLQRRLAERAERERGSFRAFLYTAAENHRRERLRAERTGKRQAQACSDTDLLDQLPDDAADLARQFDRDWALRVLARSLERLQAEAAGAGKLTLFEALQGFLVEAPEPRDYDSIGARLGMSANSVAVAVKRLRERLRAQLRLELADTLGPATDLDQELHWLKQALRGA